MMFTVIVVGAFAALVLFGVILRFTLSRNMNVPRSAKRKGTNGSGAGLTGDGAFDKKDDRSSGYAEPRN